jgi:hypothetical protein
LVLDVMETDNPTPPTSTTVRSEEMERTTPLMREIIYPPT